VDFFFYNTDLFYLRGVVDALVATAGRRLAVEMAPSADAIRAGRSHPSSSTVRDQTMMSSQPVVYSALAQVRPRKVLPEAVARPVVNAVALALMALAYLPLLILQARETWLHPHYRFFPFVIVGAGVLTVRAWGQLGPIAPGARDRAGWFLAGCWVILAAACALGSPWLATIAAMLELLAVAYAVGGVRLVGALLPSWAFLWLAIPPPMRVDFMLVTLLQSTATRWCSAILDLLGVFHLRQGNVIHLPQRPVLIDEACSGIHSLFAVMAGTIFLAVWARRSRGRGIALVASAVTWVFLCNVLRIVVVVAVAARWQVDLATGWIHEALGLAIFVLALWLTAGTDCLFSLVPHVLRLRREWVLGELIGPQPRCVPAAAGPAPRRSLAGRVAEVRWSRLASWPLTAAYGVLILAQPLAIAPIVEGSLLPDSMAACRLASLRAADLPASWGPFQRSGSQAAESKIVQAGAAISSRWLYRWGERTVHVSLDGPFLGWHELSGCYVAAGWVSQGRSVQPGDSNRGAFRAVRMERSPGLHGEPFYSC
jgi:exosortase